MIKVEEIQWLNEKHDITIEADLMWKLERVLEENPISSVLDLEEERISINRFVSTD